MNLERRESQARKSPMEESQVEATQTEESQAGQMQARESQTRESQARESNATVSQTPNRIHRSAKVTRRGEYRCIIDIHFLVTMYKCYNFRLCQSFFLFKVVKGWVRS